MQPCLGEIRAFAGNYAPQNWALCNGQTVRIQDYEALYSLLGTTYGGDGVTTFGLPNLRGRIIVNQGQMPGGQNYTIGNYGGAPSVTLTVANIPAHQHSFSIATNDGDTTAAANNYIGIPVDQLLNRPVNFFLQDNEADDTQKLVPTDTDSVTPYPGDGMAHNNMMPYMSITYIISLEGIYPQPQ